MVWVPPRWPPQPPPQGQTAGCGFGCCRTSRGHVWSQRVFTGTWILTALILQDWYWFPSSEILLTVKPAPAETWNLLQRENQLSWWAETSKDLNRWPGLLVQQNQTPEGITSEDGGPDISQTDWAGSRSQKDAPSDRRRRYFLYHHPPTVLLLFVTEKKRSPFWCIRAVRTDGRMRDATDWTRAERLPGHIPLQIQDLTCS